MSSWLNARPVRDLSDEDLETVARCMAVSHVDACYEYLVQKADGPTDLVDPSIAPFCGCTTCAAREILHAAWPAMAELARRAQIRRSN